MSIDITSESPPADGVFVVATPLDLAQRFGDIPLSRIVFDPPPGQATEEDCILINERSERLCELVDGTLIEKVMGTYESLIASKLVTQFNNYLESHRLGIALGADGMLKLRLKLIRVPDVSFISKEQLRKGKFPRRGVAAVAPTIAVEVISVGNTKREMKEKLAEYFHYGAAEVWFFYPDTKTVLQYTSPDTARTITEGDSLTTPVMPGFSCSVASLFVHPDEQLFDDDAATT